MVRLQASSFLLEPILQSLKESTILAKLLGGILMERHSTASFSTRNESSSQSILLDLLSPKIGESTTWARSLGTTAILMEFFTDSAGILGCLQRSHMFRPRTLSQMGLTSLAKPSVSMTIVMGGTV